MGLPMHAGYRHLVDKARASHAQGRRTDLITSEEVELARLYCYAFRNHTIGAFHATRGALASCPVRDSLARAHLLRAGEQLDDLINQGMESVPDDFRAVLSAFYRYDCGVHRVIDALEQAHGAAGEAMLARLGQRFVRIMGQVVGSNGIYLTRDTEAPEQATFVVPNLGSRSFPWSTGITIRGIWPTSPRNSWTCRCTATTSGSRSTWASILWRGT